MEGNKKEQHEKKEKEEKLWCEHYKEYVNVKEGCRHRDGYCPYRKQCILYLSAKFKDF
jgi:tRNA A37 methylthiotransferase MiaB